jgi:hypothetical protein
MINCTYKYPKYGMLSVDYNDDLNIDIESYKPLYDKSLSDILQLITPSITTKLIRNQLEIIKLVQHKLHDPIIYENLEDFYDESLCPLPPNDIKLLSTSYPKTNYEFFKFEDFDTFNWLVYHRYLSSKIDIAISYETIKNEITKYNKLILELKKNINLLRPFQSAFIEKIDIDTYISYAGQTPSIPSGHCVQGFLFGAFIYYYHKEYFDNNYDDLNLLVRVSYDTGYRRILAGVHYYIDMIGSYLVFNNIIKHNGIYYQTTRYRKYLKLCIRNFTIN